MKRILSLILFILASIYSSVITPRWHEGGYTGAFAPYLRDRDNGNPYAGFIMQCGVRSVVYQNYGVYYPPQPPPPPPAPKQKDVHDIVHHPENCKDWSADDFYNAIKSVYATELIPYPDDYKYPSYRSDNCSDFNIEHFLIYSDHQGSHYVTSEQCKKLMSTDGLFGYDNFWTCIREKMPFGCFLIGHAYRYEDQSSLSKKSRERLYKEYKKIEKEYWDLYRQRDREEQAWIDEMRVFGESVKEKLNQSFDELYQEKEAYVEQEEWLERYACGNAQRIKDRIAALEDIKSVGMQYTSKQYQLSPQAQAAIQKAGYRKLKYIYSGGNQLQHVIHQDCINLVEETIVIPSRSIAHPYTNALLTCTNSAREYNMLGDLHKAMDITDFCWSLIDHGKNLIAQAAYAVADTAIEYGQAIGRGCIGGAVGAGTGIAQEAYDHPWQTLASVAAGEVMFSFVIGKLIVHVADIGITYCCIDADKGIKKFEEFIQPITDLITALTQAQQQGGAQTVQCVTHIATQLCAQALLFKGMTQFCDILKNKALTFAKNNPLVSFDAYAQTPDGSIIKVYGNCNSVRCPNQYNNLKDALKIEEFTSIINVTRHGIQRLIERGFSPADVNNVINNYTFIKKQLDGAIVYVKQIGNDYNVIIFNEAKKAIITALKGIDKNALHNLGRNYEWK